MISPYRLVKAKSSELAAAALWRIQFRGGYFSAVAAGRADSFANEIAVFPDAERRGAPTSFVTSASDERSSL